MQTLKYLIFSCCGVFAFCCSVAADPNRIGVVIPLTGGAAASGETIRNSIELASELYNKDKAVEFKYEDDQLTPKNTVAVVQKLVNVEKVAGLIVFGTPTSLAVTGIAESHKIPMIAFSILDKVVEGRQFVVKHWVRSQDENKLVSEQAEKRGYKKIAVVATTNDAMLALRDHFNNSNRSQIILNDDFSREEVNFSPVIAKIISLKADAVYNLLWAPQTGLFARQLKEAGYNGEIFGVQNLEDMNEIAAAQGALEGAWLVTGDDSKGADYLTKYQHKFGKQPVAGGLNAFDAAKLMVEGFNSGDLNSFLHNVKNFKGSYGIYDASGKNDFMIKAAIKRVSGKQAVSFNN